MICSLFKRFTLIVPALCAALFPQAQAQVVDLPDVEFADGSAGRPLVDNIRLVSVGSIAGGMQQSALMPGESGFIFFAKQNGIVEQYSFNPDGTLNDDTGFLLNVAAQRPNFGNNPVASADGLRGIAFHPDFANTGTAGFGKFYTMQSESRSGSPTHALNPAWSFGTGSNVDSVLTEWSFNAAGALIGQREVYRVQFPAGHHIGQNIGFNPTLNPGDADYGNLYITFGDSGGQLPGSDNFSADNVITTVSQDPTTVLGKIIRINPLQDGANAFTIPTNNPFTSDAGVLDEIYASGFRNPQTLSFDTETGKLLVGDISHNNIEEINLIEAGKNYGWAEREGTYDFATPFSSNTLTEVSLAERQSDAFTYPVAQFDHIDESGGEAIVGGFVYHGDATSELLGWYIFGDLADDKLYIARADELTNDEDPAGIFFLPIEDEFGDPITLGEELGIGANGRANIRFAQDADGEVYIISKTTGAILRLEGTPVTVPEPGSLALLGLTGLFVFRRRRLVRP